MVIANNKNRDLDVTSASKHLFGRGLIIKENVNSVGFSCGSWKVIRLDDFVSFQGIANLNSKALRTIG